MLILMLIVSSIASASVTPEQCKAIGKAFINGTQTIRGYRKAHCRKINAKANNKNARDLKQQ